MAALLISADHYKNWEKSGKSEFVKKCRGLIEKEADLFSATHVASVKRLLYELCVHVMRGHLKPDQAGLVLEEVQNLHPEVASLAADIFNVLGSV